MSKDIGTSVKYYGNLSRDVLFEAFRAFFSDNCLNLSAALAFYSILSVIPIIFFILFASGLILGSSESAYTTVVEFVRQLNPYMEDRLLLGIKNLPETSRLLGWVGFVFLLWISTMIFASLDVAFTIIFRVEKRAHFFFKSILIAAAVIPFGVIVILFSILINIVAVMIENTGLVLFGINISNLIANATLIRYIIPLVVIIIFFTLIFKFIPNKKIYFSHAFMGGVICSVLLEIAKYLFGFYLSSGGNPANFVYGPLNALIYIVIWVFYLASIILFTAEIVSVLERKTNNTQL